MKHEISQMNNATQNQSVLKDRLDAEGATPAKDILFPILKNSSVPHQLRVNWYSTRVSLNCSRVSQGIFGILAVLESASFMNKSKQRKVTKDGRLSSSHHLTLLVKAPMKENPVIGNVVRMPFVGKLVPSTRPRIAILANKVTCDHLEQSCAGRLHLQSNLSERRSNTIRKTLYPTTRAEKSH